MTVPEARDDSTQGQVGDKAVGDWRLALFHSRESYLFVAGEGFFQDSFDLGIELL